MGNLNVITCTHVYDAFFSCDAAIYSDIYNIKTTPDCDHNRTEPRIDKIP